MLLINNLHAEIGGKPILKSLSLTVNAGVAHAIVGSNGAGAQFSSSSKQRM